MAWNTNRKARLPRNWASLRRRVMHRDKGVCQMPFSDGRLCGAEATDVDHIVPGDDHSMVNLRALCRWCHARKSASEGGTAAALTRVRIDRPKPTHPALED